MAALGRHRSTIYRELKRDWWRDAEVPRADGYWPVSAQALAARLRHALGKLAGRLRLEQDGRNRLCHETIHRLSIRRKDGARSLRGTCPGGGGFVGLAVRESPELSSFQRLRVSATDPRS